MLFRLITGACAGAEAVPGDALLFGSCRPGGQELMTGSSDLAWSNGMLLKEKGSNDA
jgi:hypothetical protein